MFPAAFAYERPHDLDGALGLLAEHGDEASVLAGGHSLLPLMKLRLAAPELLVDVSRLAELRRVEEESDHLVIGAALTHQEVIDHPAIRRWCPLLGAVTRGIGDPQVRHRGTIGGALAHGDAAGDLPAVALALEAELVLASRNGTRNVTAAAFFRDYLETDRRDDELVVGVRVPKLGEGWRHGHEKFNRVSHAWAIVGSCTLVHVEGGRVTEARVGLTHMATVPLRASATEAALVGGPASSAPIEDAAALADEGSSPPEDANADATYRRQLARVLTRRALARALSTAAHDRESTDG